MSQLMSQLEGSMSQTTSFRVGQVGPFAGPLMGKGERERGRSASRGVLEAGRCCLFPQLPGTGGRPRQRSNPRREESAPPAPKKRTKQHSPTSTDHAHSKREAKRPEARGLGRMSQDPARIRPRHDGRRYPGPEHARHERGMGGEDGASNGTTGRGDTGAGKSRHEKKRSTTTPTGGKGGGQHDEGNDERVDRVLRGR